MPRLAANQVPAYRLHKRSGRAIVTLSGRDYMLGLFGSPASKARYHELLAKWEAVGRRPMHLSPEELRPAPIDLEPALMTIDELCDRFNVYAAGYYRKNGLATSEPRTFKIAMAVLRDAFGKSAAKEFGPLKLREVRDRMVKRKWVRKSINIQIKRLRQVFAWAVEEELLDVAVYLRLKLKPLKKNRSEAVEADRVKPVPDAYVDALQSRLPAAVWAMIELQRLTGMRPGEVVAMRGVDLDQSGPVWIYTPTDHKTQHHDHTRTICLGPRAQAIVGPFLAGRPVHAPLFDPREAIAQARAAKATKGKPRRADQPANARKTARRVADHYTSGSYRRAIANACDVEPTVTRWHPHQLRHNYATTVRKHGGAELAQIALGHRNMNTTEIYAERDMEQLKRVAARLG